VFGDGGSDTLGRSGDEGDFSVEFAHFESPATGAFEVNAAVIDSEPWRRRLVRLPMGSTYWVANFSRKSWWQKSGFAGCAVWNSPIIKSI